MNLQDLAFKRRGLNSNMNTSNRQYHSVSNFHNKFPGQIQGVPLNTKTAFDLFGCTPFIPYKDFKSYDNIDSSKSKRLSDPMASALQTESVNNTKGMMTTKSEMFPGLFNFKDQNNPSNHLARICLKLSEPLQHSDVVDGSVSSVHKGIETSMNDIKMYMLDQCQSTPAQSNTADIHKKTLEKSLQSNSDLCGGISSLCSPNSSIFPVDCEVYTDDCGIQIICKYDNTNGVDTNIEAKASMLCSQVDYNNTDFIMDPHSWHLPSRISTDTSKPLKYSSQSDNSRWTDRHKSTVSSKFLQQVRDRKAEALEKEQKCKKSIDTTISSCEDKIARLAELLSRKQPSYNVDELKQVPRGVKSKESSPCGKAEDSLALSDSLNNKQSDANLCSNCGDTNSTTPTVEGDQSKPIVTEDSIIELGKLMNKLTISDQVCSPADESSSKTMDPTPHNPPHTETNGQHTGSQVPRILENNSCLQPPGEIENRLSVPDICVSAPDQEASSESPIVILDLDKQKIDSDLIERKEHIEENSSTMSSLVAESSAPLSGILPCNGSQEAALGEDTATPAVETPRQLEVNSENICVNSVSLVHTGPISSNILSSSKSEPYQEASIKSQDKPENISADANHRNIILTDNHIPESDVSKLSNPESNEKSGSVLIENQTINKTDKIVNSKLEQKEKSLKIIEKNAETLSNVTHSNDLDPNTNKPVVPQTSNETKTHKNKTKKNHRLTATKVNEATLQSAQSCGDNMEISEKRISPVKERHASHNKVCSKKHKNEHCIKKHRHKEKEDFKRDIKDDLNYDSSIESSEPIYFSPENLKLYSNKANKQNKKPKTPKKSLDNNKSPAPTEPSGSRSRLSESMEKCVNYITSLPAQVAPACKKGKKTNSREKLSSTESEDCSGFDEIKGRFKRNSSEYESDDSFVIIFSDAKKDESNKQVVAAKPQRIPKERVRLPSECESEDSFVICFEGDSASSVEECYGNDQIYSDSDSYSSGSDVESDTESEEHGSNSEMSSDECETIMEQPPQLKSCLKRRTSPKPDAATRKVSFDPKPEVHKMVVWSFAYKQARISPWERIARDTERFKQRIRDTEVSLEWVFKPKHRNIVFFQRFRPLLMRAIREEKEAKAREAKRRKEEEEERVRLKAEEEKLEEEERIKKEERLKQEETLESEGEDNINVQEEIVQLIETNR